MEPRVLFICKQRVDSYGFSFGLLNSAKFVSIFLSESGVESELSIAVDGNSVDRLVTEYDPTHVIIEALWITPNKLNEIMSLNRHKNRTWIVRIHSRIPFIAHEGIAMEWLHKYKILQQMHGNLIIAPNDPEFTNDLNMLGIKAVFLPNVYCASVEKKYIRNYDKERLDVACFGAIRPFKNHLIQAVAAIRFANAIGCEMNFHINGDRQEQRGDQAFKNLEALFSNSKHKLVEHHWVPHRQFLDLIQEMDIGMQVSLSESFNIVSADFVTCGVPIVVSPEIRWMPWIFKADPTSSYSISLRLGITYVLSLLKIHNISKMYLRWCNKRSGKKWLKYLSTESSS